MLLIIVGHSGSGKTTLRNNLIEKYQFQIPKEFITREKREGETEYTYLSKDEFVDMAFDNQFSEIVFYNGNGYATQLDKEMPKEENFVTIAIPSGQVQLKEFCRANNIQCVSIFMDVPPKELEKRMKNRGDSKENIEKRIKIDTWTFDDADIVLDEFTQNRTPEEILEEVVGELRSWFNVKI